jgi:hypothetical protein
MPCIGTDRLRKLAAFIFRIKAKTLKNEPIISHEILIPVYKMTDSHPRRLQFNTLPILASDWQWFSACHC